jgi:hypothetical protein
MQINLDTSIVKPSEIRGLIAFLTTLLPVNSENNLTPQTPEAPTTLREQIEASVEQTATGSRPVAPSTESTSGPILVEPTTEHPAKRTRRTKEQIAADEAAKADRSPTVGDQLAAAEAARKATADQAAQATNGSTKIDADQLRGLLNGYIARHSMEEAIEKLRAFGCNRVTEALALESAKLNELAATLNG